MNKGISLATGDYLCFLNAGDCFHEDNTLQQMVHTIIGNELPDVLYGETAIVDKNGHFLRMRRLSAPETLTWKSFKQGMLVCHQAFFPRHTLVEPYDCLLYTSRPTSPVLPSDHGAAERKGFPNHELRMGRTIQTEHETDRAFKPQLPFQQYMESN